MSLYGMNPSACLETKAMAVRVAPELAVSLPTLLRDRSHLLTTSQSCLLQLLAHKKPRLALLLLENRLLRPRRLRALHRLVLLRLRLLRVGVLRRASVDDPVRERSKEAHACYRPM